MAMPEFQRCIVRDHAGKMTEITTSLKIKNFEVIKFEVAYVFNEFNKKFNVGRSGNDGKLRAVFGEIFIQHGRLISIALFNILENSKYNKEINKLEIFKFTKHLRNGSSHNNIFNFEGKKIKKVNWRDKCIGQNEKGKQVFGEFIFLPDLVILINDISEILYNIDNIIKTKFITP